MVWVDSVVLKFIVLKYIVLKCIVLKGVGVLFIISIREIGSPVIRTYLY